MTDHKVQQLARDMSAAFEGRVRDSGESFRVLRDGSPQWMTDVAMAAHGDMLPDDWRYSAIEDAAGWIAGADGSADLDDEAHAFADANVDVYNADRTAWLSSHLDRAGYVDEAREEYDATDDGIMADIGRGQYVELLEVYTSVLSELRAIADEDEDTDED